MVDRLDDRNYFYSISLGSNTDPIRIMAEPIFLIGDQTL